MWCICSACVCVCAWACSYVQRRMSGVLYHSPPYSPETGLLTKPGTRLISIQQDSTFLLSLPTPKPMLNAKVTGVLLPRALEIWTLVLVVMLVQQVLFPTEPSPQSQEPYLTLSLTIPLLTHSVRNKTWVSIFNTKELSNGIRLQISRGHWVPDPTVSTCLSEPSGYLFFKSKFKLRMKNTGSMLHE